MIAKNIMILFSLLVLMAIPLEIKNIQGVSFNTNIVEQLVDYGSSVIQEYTPNSAELHEFAPAAVVRKITKDSAKHVQCLATAIYFEAANEPYLGQIAVARVVMNRVLHGFGSNPCSVIYQTNQRQAEAAGTPVVCQFSWYCEGKTTPPKNAPDYKQALQIASQVVEENRWSDIIPNNVLYFHATSVNPRWRHKREMTIGNHVFYSSGREKNTVKVASK